MLPPNCFTEYAAVQRRKLSTKHLIGATSWKAVVGCSLSSLLAFAFMTGCNGGSSSPPVTPKSASIATPLDGSRTGNLPISVTVNLTGGATAKDIAIALDGVDVSASFVPDGNGNLIAQLSSTQVYVGSNRLTASIVSSSNGTAATASSKATFTYDPTLAKNAPPLTYPTRQADVIPVQTRVKYNGSNWGIQVGNTAYASDPNITDGFQVLKLNRQTLSVVSNQTFQVLSDQDAVTFALSVTPDTTHVSSCGYAGCLQIVQSLNSPGYNPCPGSTSCSVYTGAFTGVGGTATITYMPQNDSDVGYSFIGNVGQDGLHAGSQDERITCTSSDCGSFPKPDLATVYNPGIAPNGQGENPMPTINQTSSTDCPTTTTSSQMPAVTYCRNGSIGGSLVLGGDNNYTFSYSDLPVRFQMTVAPDDPNKSLLIVSSAGSFPGLSEESAQLPADKFQPVGGFHLVILDATTFQVYANNTYTVDNRICTPQSSSQNYCKGPDGTNIYELDQLYKDLAGLNSRRFLFFLHSVGNLDHNYVYGKSSNPGSSGTGTYTGQDVWDRVAQSVQNIGGTYVTFDSLNNSGFLWDLYDQYYTKKIPQDDYNMVGQWWINASGVPNPYATEQSTQISLQTINLATPPVSNMYGVLNKERDGYYRVTAHSLSSTLVPQQSLDLSSAALLPQTPWPISTASTGGTLAAYTWISNQLLGCITSCGDIHAAYANLNVSPNSWQGLLGQLIPPADGGDGFTNADFTQVRGQLSLEFQYLAALRAYQANLQGLLQAEQSNVSIILQQVVDSIDGTIPIQTRGASTSYGIESWRTDVMDGLNIVAALSVFVPVDGADDVTNTVVALADFGIDASAKHTVDAKGRTLEELTHTLYSASEIAQKKTQEFAQILTTNGNDFARISLDWGRLQKVGIPLINNQNVWAASADGALLNAFDTATTRALYLAIMPSAFAINQYQFAAPGVHYQGFLQPQMDGGQCAYYDFMNYMAGNVGYQSYAYWPGAPIDGLGTPIESAVNTADFDVWWDVWTINFTNSSNGNNITCPQAQYQPATSFFSDSGILDRLDPTDPSRLGIYKPWLFQRSGIPVYQQNPSYKGYGEWYRPGQSLPFVRLGDRVNSLVDPANY